MNWTIRCDPFLYIYIIIIHLIYFAKQGKRDQKRSQVWGSVQDNFFALRANSETSDLWSLLMSVSQAYTEAKVTRKFNLCDRSIEVLIR